ncbi:hypothetical protein [uncultured Fibrobacter sp.]|uniref:hypothetical protein n=1 Tax=uncultured Fibrobacter sp. TaxID=261512 RepID=UPI00280495A4|nr:hypothetical protein [uncultured Fibrobacter sp.]
MTKLNDCAQNKTWTKTAKAAGTIGEGSVEFTSGGDANCLALTPSFKDIGTEKKTNP